MMILLRLVGMVMGMMRVRSRRRKRRGRWGEGIADSITQLVDSVQFRKIISLNCICLTKTCTVLYCTSTYIYIYIPSPPPFPSIFHDMLLVAEMRTISLGCTHSKYVQYIGSEGEEEGKRNRSFEPGKKIRRERQL